VRACCCKESIRFTIIDDKFRTIHTSYWAHNNWILCQPILYIYNRYQLRTCRCHPLSPRSSPLKANFWVTQIHSQVHWTFSHWPLSFQCSRWRHDSHAHYPLSLLFPTPPHPRILPPLRTWRTFQIVPMSGCTTFERLNRPINAPHQPTKDYQRTNPDLPHQKTPNPKRARHDCFTAAHHFLRMKCQQRYCCRAELYPSARF